MEAAAFSNARHAPPEFSDLIRGPSLKDDLAMSLYRLSDQWVTRMYEGIRKEVAADAGSNFHLIGEATKQRAGYLAEELRRRGIQFVPIEWPADAHASPSERKTRSHSTLWRRILNRPR